jgi:hypothetical protein
MKTKEDNLLPLASAAARLRVSRGWLRAEAEAGKLPCLFAGKAILFDLPSVLNILIERARKGACHAK